VVPCLLQQPSLSRLALLERIKRGGRSHLKLRQRLRRQRLLSQNLTHDKARAWMGFQESYHVMGCTLCEQHSESHVHCGIQAQYQTKEADCKHLQQYPGTSSDKGGRLQAPPAAAAAVATAAAFLPEAAAAAAAAAAALSWPAQGHTCVQSMHS
jgi:hypothetical protein